MPKQKNSSAAKKRFKVMASGKVKRGRQNRRHLLIRKETATKRNSRRAAYVEGKQANTIKQLVGNQD